MFESYHSHIIDNVFDSGQNFAIVLESDTYNITIYENYFLSNNLVSENPLQAYDAGVSNTWYDVDNLIGNYWSNLGTNTTYEISGSAESRDIYPLSI